MPWKLLAELAGLHLHLARRLLGAARADRRHPDRRLLRAAPAASSIVDDLYRRGGRYEYAGGFNPAALVALVAGIAPNVPGFLAQAFPARFAGVGALWTGLYAYAWFLGFAVAGIVYLLLMRGRR